MTAPVIILVRPQMGENIGAAARVMANFGLSELRLVAPRDGWPNPAATDMATSATPILDAARLYDTAVEAVADIERVYATSARLRDMVKPVMAPEEVVSTVRTEGHRTAILFGPERSGLENDEVVLAHALLTYPVSEVHKSVNLAQAVCVFAYEWAKQGGGLIPVPPAGEREQPASGEHLQGLFAHLETVLDAKGFYKTEDMRPRMVQNLRNLFMRADLTVQDVQTLRGMIRCLAER